MKTKNEGIDDRSETNELLAPASVGLFVLLYLSCLKATLWKPCINIFLKCREKSRSCTILLKFVSKIKVGPCLLGLTKVFFVSDVKLNSALTVKELCYVERIKWPTACVVVGTTRAATCSSGFLAVIALLPVWEWFMELVMVSKDLSKIFQGARLDPITYQRKMISLLGLGALPFAIFLSNPFCFPSRPVSLQEAVGAGHVLLLCPLLWLWVYLSCCPTLGPRSPPSPQGGQRGGGVTLTIVTWISFEQIQMF